MLLRASPARTIISCTRAREALSRRSSSHFTSTCVGMCVGGMRGC